MTLHHASMFYDILSDIEEDFEEQYYNHATIRRSRSNCLHAAEQIGFAINSAWSAWPIVLERVP